MLELENLHITFNKGTINEKPVNVKFTLPITFKF